MDQYEKGIFVMDYLKTLGFDMITIGEFIDDKNLEKSYQTIFNNPKISKREFLNKFGDSRGF